MSAAAAHARPAHALLVRSGYGSLLVRSGYSYESLLVRHGQESLLVWRAAWQQRKWCTHVGESAFQCMLSLVRSGYEALLVRSGYESLLVAKARSDS